MKCYILIIETIMKLLECYVCNGDFEEIDMVKTEHGYVCIYCLEQYDNDKGNLPDYHNYY